MTPLLPRLTIKFRVGSQDDLSPGTNRKDRIMTAQIVKANWYKYDEGGANPTTACESGAYYYFYDALGNVDGVLEEKNGLYHYYKWEMDAFGNDLPGGNDFLAMDQSGPKEHLTGKMYDTVTGLYYFHARWYDPQVGRFVSSDNQESRYYYKFCLANPINFYDIDGNAPTEIRVDEMLVINPPPGIGAPGTNFCGCDTTLLLKYFHYWTSMYEFYNKNNKDLMQKPEKPGVAAETYCPGMYPNLKEKRIEFYSHSADDCVNQCAFEHEVTHYRRHRDSRCKPLPGFETEEKRESDAYCVTLNCTNRMLEFHGVHKQGLPSGCSSSNVAP